MAQNKRKSSNLTYFVTPNFLMDNFRLLYIRLSIDRGSALDSPNSYLHLINQNGITDVTVGERLSNWFLWPLLSSFEFRGCWFMCCWCCCGCCGNGCNWGWDWECWNGGKNGTVLSSFKSALAIFNVVATKRDKVGINARILNLIICWLVWH